LGLNFKNASKDAGATNCASGNGCAKYNHIMLVLLLMDHRLALVALVGLLVAAGVPLAFAWVRLLPEDAPPFAIEPGSFPSVDKEVVAERAGKPRWEGIVSVILLSCLTLTYAIRVPGFPRETLTCWVDGVVSGSSEHWVLLSARIFLPAMSGAAGVFAALRPGSLRVPLLAAAVLVLLLWFLAPVLQAAMLGSF
jgi:hypothetical protein